MLAYAAQGLVERRRQPVRQRSCERFLGRAEDGARRPRRMRSGAAVERGAPRAGRSLHGVPRRPRSRCARRAGRRRLGLAQPSISSQLIDNLNASIHVRALLTDLFLIDEILKSATTRQPAS